MSRPSGSVVALFTALMLAAGAAPLPATAAAEGDARLAREFGERFFDRFWQLNPEAAISSGYYKVADRLIVPDAASRKREREQLEQWLVQLRRIDPRSLSPNARADWVLLENEFVSSIWGIDEYRAWEWNPAVYNVAEPFAVLLGTQYAPVEQRLRTVTRRLQNVPAFYGAARANIRTPTREHTRLAIEQNRGALSVFGPELDRQIADSGLSASERELLTRRVAAARTAIENYIGWLGELQERLADGSAPSRSFRVGPATYEKRFEYNIQSGDTARALYESALAEKERLLARMSLLSDLLWPKYFPNAPSPDDRFDKIGRLIGKLSEQHVAREDFFAEIQRQIPMLEKFVTGHGLLELDPSKPLQVRETPPHKRGIAGASIDAPGPYDPSQPTYYNVTPLDDLSPERAESYLREYNRWMLPILNIHEAIPGHYAQLVHANRSPSLIKTIFGNGAMVEGWAVYSERMMLESGFGDHSAEYWLIYSKWILRSVSNAILDYSVHVLDMS
ncbi:MAG TPA: DUF885 domain-containing protein, partial [Steroidobacteraceae bacterium]|nr:DUF885 domain-containing protein [Steroidobacteraceae bacterium]